MRPFAWAAICPVLKPTAWRKINLRLKSIQIIAVPACSACASLRMCMPITAAICSSKSPPQSVNFALLFADVIHADFCRRIEMFTSRPPSVRATCSQHVQSNSSRGCQSYYPAGFMCHCSSLKSSSAQIVRERMAFMSLFLQFGAVSQTTEESSRVLQGAYDAVIVQNSWIRVNIVLHVSAVINECEVNHNYHEYVFVIHFLATHSMTFCCIFRERNNQYNKWSLILFCYLCSHLQYSKFGSSFKILNLKMTPERMWLVSAKTRCSKASLSI